MLIERPPLGPGQAPDTPRAIRVVLDEGEALGNFAGPIEFSVPEGADGNKEWDEIKARNLKIVDAPSPRPPRGGRT